LAFNRAFFAQLKPFPGSHQGILTSASPRDRVEFTELKVEKVRVISSEKGGVSHGSRSSEGRTPIAFGLQFFGDVFKLRKPT
jgi:hypothetical protein